MLYLVRNLFIFCFMAVLLSFTPTDLQKYRLIKNDFFKRGEHIEYLVHYGPLVAGTAAVDVHPKHYLLNNRYCYRVDIKGKTSGVGGALVTVNDEWRSYIDTASFIPHRFYRNIEEGDFRRKELTDFDPSSNTAVMKFEQFSAKEKDESKKKKNTVKVNVPDYVQDIVSGYYYLRTIGFNTLSIGEVVTVPGILEDKLYNLKVRFLGKDVTRTKFGKINAFKLVPIMPENGLFSGESSVRFWVSDDKNRVPVRIEADMFIGKVVIEITNHRNLRHPLNFTK